MTKILAFAGSARKESLNKTLVKIAAAGAEEAGAEVTVIDLADYPMPIFNEDLEAAEGMPEHAARFKQLLIDHDGFLIASPEYNSAFSPLLKNAIDWASRSTSDDEAPLSGYRGKVAAIMACSPGGLGGIRGLVFLRMLLGNIGVTVIPDQQAVPNAAKAFTPEGSLSDEKKQAAIKSLGKQVVSIIDRLKA
jgi:NAD(P)H-dependent FMN reductase